MLVVGFYKFKYFVFQRRLLIGFDNVRKKENLVAKFSSVGKAGQEDSVFLSDQTDRRLDLVLVVRLYCSDISIGTVCKRLEEELPKAIHRKFEASKSAGKMELTHRDIERHTFLSSYVTLKFFLRFNLSKWWRHKHGYFVSSSPDMAAPIQVEAILDPMESRLSTEIESKLNASLLARQHVKLEKVELLCRRDSHSGIVSGILG